MNELRQRHVSSNQGRGKRNPLITGTAKKGTKLALAMYHLVRMSYARIHSPVAVSVFKSQTQPQQEATVNPITGKEILKGFAFSRGKLPKPLKQLQMDLKKLMLSCTAPSLKENKRNNLKDSRDIVGPMVVVHFLILSKTATVPYLRVETTPQGPTLTFKIHFSECGKVGGERKKR
ncbi:hypothetical protein VNO77_03999 [Canavalia gladiata]|uniref:Brix domain-containing protein n=1 Tax=Canavalia gladiata TaxID=3824 RepID=A0AAN9R7D6_CANGL